MQNTYLRENKKILKYPVTIFLIAIPILLVIYSYFITAIGFNEMFTIFLENSFDTEQEVLHFIANSDTNNILVAMLNVLTPRLAITYALASVNSLGPIVTCIIGAIFFGVEYNYGTLKQTLISGISKKELLIAKLISLITISLLIISISIIVALFLSFFVPNMYSLPIDALQINNSVSIRNYFLQIIATLLSLVLWGIVGGGITVLSKSLAIGVIVGVAYPFFEMTILHRFEIGQRFPLFIQRSMLPQLFYEIELGGAVSFYPMPEVYTLSQTLLFTSMYIALFISITLLIFKNQKVPMD